MNARRCPHCGLFNPPNAVTCDCGYDFVAERAPAPPPESVRARRRREWQAFWVVPLVAALAWYVLILIELALVNGRLRLRTDVMAMAIGALLLGLPAASAATVFLTVPLYLIVRRTAIIMNRAVVLAAGGVLGFGLASAVSYASDEWSMLPPWRGLGIGVIAAASWMHRGRMYPCERRFSGISSQTIDR